MHRYDVYGVGNALVDIEFEIPDASLTELGVDKGLMTLIEEDRHHALLASLAEVDSRPCGGGSAGNTMTAVGQLGARGFYSCKVADDEPGHFYINDLTSHGVDSNLSTGSLETGHTGKCIVLITPDAQRSMSTYLGITQRFSVAELDESAIADSAHLYIEGYLVPEPNARAAAIRAREVAQGAGARTALTLSDENMVKFFRPGLDEIIGDGLDLIFANEDEAALMAGADSIEACVEGMKSLARTFVVTRGEKGAVLFDGERVTEVAASRVEPVDSNGAGDVYAGAFLYGLSQGMPFDRCGELAGAAATTLVQRFGARLSGDEIRAVARSVG